MKRTLLLLLIMLGHINKNFAGAQWTGSSTGQECGN